jgi:hypothetical protein
MMHGTQLKAELMHCCRFRPILGNFQSAGTTSTRPSCLYPSQKEKIVIGHTIRVSDALLSLGEKEKEKKFLLVAVGGNRARRADADTTAP